MFRYPMTESQPHLLSSGQPAEPTLVAPPGLFPTLYSTPPPLTNPTLLEGQNDNRVLKLRPTASVHDGEDDEECTLTPACRHNNWDNVRVKRGLMTMACRVCGVRWKTVSTIVKCPDFFHGVCFMGVDCPLLHVHRYKNRAKSPDPANYAASEEQDVVISAAVSAVMKALGGQEAGVTPASIVPQLKHLVEGLGRRVAVFEANPYKPMLSASLHEGVLPSFPPTQLRPLPACPDGMHMAPPMQRHRDVFNLCHNQTPQFQQQPLYSDNMNTRLHAPCWLTEPTRPQYRDQQQWETNPNSDHFFQYYPSSNPAAHAGPSYVSPSMHPSQSSFLQGDHQGYHHPYLFPGV